MSNWRYTIIQHIPRTILNITVLEYCVLDIVYQSQTHTSYSKNGWTDVGCHSIANFLGLSSGTVKNIFDRMEYMGYIERNGNFSKRTTSSFYDVAYLKNDSEIESVQKLNVQKLNGKRSEIERPHVQKLNGKRSEIEHKIEIKESFKELKEDNVENDFSTPFLEKDEIEEIEQQIYASKLDSKGRKKKVAAKKKEDSANKAPVDEMYKMYIEAFKRVSGGESPVYQKKDFVALAAIHKALLERAKEKTQDFQPKSPTDLWKVFLEKTETLVKSPKETWLHDNFTPSILWSQFNTILVKIKNPATQKPVIPLYRENQNQQKHNFLF
jgi:hypothetical protein